VPIHKINGHEQTIVLGKQQQQQPILQPVPEKTFIHSLPIFVGVTYYFVINFSIYHGSQYPPCFVIESASFSTTPLHDRLFKRQAE